MNNFTMLIFTFIMCMFFTMDTQNKTYCKEYKLSEKADETVYTICDTDIPIAPSLNKTPYSNYIEKYIDIALKEYRNHGIPPSIKIAQAIIESGMGTSSLAGKGRAHFGVKTHRKVTGYNGPGIKHWDDDPEISEFRQYKTVADSYEGHSLFLKQNKRYADLFKLETTDYEGWAKELKKAGYATDKFYVGKLINLIRKTELYKYDTYAKKIANYENNTRTIHWSI